MQKRRQWWWFVKPVGREEVCWGKVVLGQRSPAAAPTPGQHPGTRALPKPDPAARTGPGLSVCSCCEWTGCDVLPAGSRRSCTCSTGRDRTEEHHPHWFFPGVLIGLIDPVWKRKVWFQGKCKNKMYPVIGFSEGKHTCVYMCITKKSGFTARPKLLSGSY